MTASERERRGFERRYGTPPHWLCRAPGRVSLIGGHVDYNDGLVLPVAVERDVRVLMRPRDDRTLRLHSEPVDDPAVVDLDDLRPGSVPGWTGYPAATAWALERAGHELRGVDALVLSDLPMGRGLGSSAALEVAFAAALCRAARLDLPKPELARLCRRAENEFIGVQCGIMDQMASACARADHALLIDCVSLETRHVPIPDDVRIVVFDTGVTRELRSSEFNRRREECQAALRLIAGREPAVRSYRDIATADLERLLPTLPQPHARRVRHVVTEIERVRTAADALERGDLSAVGAAMFASHRSSREDYETSCPELDALVELAAGAEGVLGARLTGAGFGGCTVNLVATDRAVDFTEQVAAGYERRFGRRPATFSSRAGAGVSVERVQG